MCTRCEAHRVIEVWCGILIWRRQTCLLCCIIISEHDDLSRCDPLIQTITQGKCPKKLTAMIMAKQYPRVTNNLPYFPIYIFVLFYISLPNTVIIHERREINRKQIKWYTVKWIAIFLKLNNKKIDMYLVQFIDFLILRMWSMIVNIPCAIDKNMYFRVVKCIMLWLFGQVN